MRTLLLFHDYSESLKIVRNRSKEYEESRVKSRKNWLRERSKKGWLTRKFKNSTK